MKRSPQRIASAFICTTPESGTGEQYMDWWFIQQDRMERHSVLQVPKVLSNIQGWKFHSMNMLTDGWVDRRDCSSETETICSFDPQSKTLPKFIPAWRPMGLWRTISPWLLIWTPWLCWPTTRSPINLNWKSCKAHQRAFLFRGLTARDDRSQTHTLENRVL